MFRRAFGFERVESIDISPFEDATIISDIGAPSPAEIDGQFDLAIDGGTLEHVFNYPVGIANLMRLVRLGGAAYTQNPCGGLAGHGFYQFSPELMYRVFCPDNGFTLFNSFGSGFPERSASSRLSTSPSMTSQTRPTSAGGSICRMRVR